MIVSPPSASCDADPNNWLEVLEAQQPHVLLVESAWQGNQGAWQYKVGAYSYPGSVGLPDLNALVEWCRSHSIPTVFWNKEDPIHFEKFKEAASLFDVVFTTDVTWSSATERFPVATPIVLSMSCRSLLSYTPQPSRESPAS